jgi:hypothetical protein
VLRVDRLLDESLLNEFDLPFSGERKSSSTFPNTPLSSTDSAASSWHYAVQCPPSSSSQHLAQNVADRVFWS